MASPRSEMEVAMQRRLNALIKKSGGGSEADAKLVEVLLQHLHSKAEYEGALGTPEGADALVRKLGLNDRDADMVQRMQAAKDIAPSIPLLDHTLTAAFLVVAAYTLRAVHERGYAPIFIALLIVIDAAVFRVKQLSANVGTWLSKRVTALGLVEGEPLTGTIQMKKWQEQSWQLVIHVAFSLIELHILSKEPWWEEPATMYRPHPREQISLPQPELQALYLAQLGVWLYTCFIHRFVDERRKDYFVMYIHHIATIALVGLSWTLGYTRAGFMVLFVHDISDIFVDLLKMVNYLKVEGRKGWFITEAAYGLCVLSWFVWRIVVFPYHILYRCAWGGAHAGMANEDPAAVIRFRVPVLDYLVEHKPLDAPYYYAGWSLCWLLFGLHLYWFKLFVMIGLRIKSEGSREASRQEYEGDSDDEGESPRLGDKAGKAAEATASSASAASAGSAAPAGVSAAH